MSIHIFIVALIVLTGLIIRDIINLGDDISNGRLLREGVIALIAVAVIIITIIIQRAVFFDSILLSVLSIVLILGNLWMAYEGFWLVKEAIDFYLLQNALVIESSNKAVEFLQEQGVEVKGDKVSFILYENILWWYIDEKYAVSISAYIYGEELTPDLVERIGVNEMFYIKRFPHTLRYQSGNLFLDYE